MQSDVTFVGGSTPAANLPAVPSSQKMTGQAAPTAPIPLGVGQPLPRPSATAQTAAITEAKIALSAEDSPTALSEGERVLKPYGISMLPELPVEGEEDPLAFEEPFATDEEDAFGLPEEKDGSDTRAMDGIRDTDTDITLSEADAPDDEKPE